MWDDAIIGEPKGRKPNSAVKIFGLAPGDKHGFSENRESYWINDCIMGLSCTIYKNTPEGKMLTELITNKVSLEKLQNYVDTAILKRVRLGVLRKRIRESQKEHFERGRCAKMAEIRATLGLPRQ